MDITEAAARAAILLQRAELCRRAARALAGDAAARLRSRAQELESEAAIEMAHAALVRHYAGDDGAASQMVSEDAES
jgi:hypothetical protein